MTTGTRRDSRADHLITPDKAALLVIGQAVRKTPLIVFEDADINMVAPLVVRALTQFNGQFCMTGSRVLVQRSVASAYRNELAEPLECL